MDGAVVHVSMTDQFSVVDIDGFIEMFIHISGDSASNLCDLVKEDDRLRWNGWGKRNGKWKGSIMVSGDREFSTYFLAGIYPESKKIYVWSDEDQSYAEWHPTEEILDRMGISKH